MTLPEHNYADLFASLAFIGVWIVCVKQQRMLRTALHREQDAHEVTKNRLSGARVQRDHWRIKAAELAGEVDVPQMPGEGS